MANLHPYIFVLDVCDCTRVTNRSRICSSFRGSAAAAVVLCPQRQGWGPGSWTRAPRACATVSASCKPPTVLCKTKWLCVFHACCKWWLLHPKMHKWRLPIHRVRCHPEQVGVDVSLGTLSAFWPSTGPFFTPLFPIKLTTPALPLPPSLLDPSLFHLLTSPLCQIKKVFHVYWAL